MAENKEYKNILIELKHEVNYLRLKALSKQNYLYGKKDNRDYSMLYSHISGEVEALTNVLKNIDDLEEYYSGKEKKEKI